MKKHISFGILFTLLTLTQAACGNSDTIDTAKETTAPSTESVTAADTEDPSLRDSLPDADFNGATYTILTQTYTEEDFIAEAETGALINDAVYRRNSAVEERFHVDLQFDSRGSIPDGTNASSTALRNSVNAGDNAYQLYSDCMLAAAPNALKNCLLDMGSLEYLDLSRVWWNQSSRTALSIDGHVFLLAGNIAHDYTTHMHCLFMNKRLGSNLDMTSTVYDSVFNGVWTVDYFQSLLKDTWQDLNGNSKPDEYDSYGYFAHSSTWSEIYTYAFGETVISHDSDGMPVLNFNQDKFASMVEKVYDLLYETEGTYTFEDYYLGMFTDGRAVFATGCLSHSFDAFSDMEDDFAILPYPKWDEAQDTYHTFSDGAAPIVGIPTTVEDVEMVGIITEGLAAEGYRTVIPAVYDKALKGRGTRDEESVRIIDIIQNGCIIDFGFVYEIGGNTMYSLISKKNKNFASYYEKKEKTWQKKLDSTIASYMKNQ